MFQSVHFSSLVLSDSLQTHGLQPARLPCPPPTPGASPDLCPSSWWCHSTISSSFIPFLLLPSIFPSMRVFSKESVLHIRWPKYWSFNLNMSPSNEYSGLISFRMDWLDLLAVQGTLKSLLQQYSSKASVLQCSAFFMVQVSYSYMTTGKTIALTRRTFVSKVMSLLFNMLSRLVILKSSLNIWNFMVHLLLKLGLENFEHFFASMWDECSCAIVWTFFGIALLWDWNENWPFPVLWPLLSFSNLLAYWVQHIHSIIF